MNHISDIILTRANEEAIYNLYLYLVFKTTPAEHESLGTIVLGLESALKNQSPQKWNARDIYRLKILKNATSANQILADSVIGNLTRSESGLTACSFIRPDKSVSVVFRGTGTGEWLDNGEGLSGIPEENTYITYGRGGRELYRYTAAKDYATDQQVEALNWFGRIASVNGWSKNTAISVSGHSKGGNKAQFIALHSDLVNDCYSFDGQGFSPEALSAFKMQYGEDFKARRERIYSFSADNDYVNVLGKRLVSKKQIYYFESYAGFHYMEAILNKDGTLRKQCDKGSIPQHVEKISDELMSISPFVRKYATLGVIKLFQNYSENDPNHTKKRNDP